MLNAEKARRKVTLTTRRMVQVSTTTGLLQRLEKEKKNIPKVMSILYSSWMICNPKARMQTVSELFGMKEANASNSAKHHKDRRPKSVQRIGEVRFLYAQHINAS